jgi:hypothetical protein
MENTEQKAETRKPSVHPGRKPASSAAISRRSREKTCSLPRKKPKQGKAGSALRTSLDCLVIENSVQIAEALVESAIQGSVAGVKLVADLTGAKNLPKEQPKKKKRSVHAYLRQLALDPPWQGERPPRFVSMYDTQPKPGQ